MSRQHDVHVVCPSPRARTDPDTVGGVHYHFAAVSELRQYPIRERLDLSPEGLLLTIRMVFAIVAMTVACVGARRRHGFDVTYFCSKYVAAPVLVLGRRHGTGVFVYSERNLWPWLHPKPSGNWARVRYLANAWLGKFVCDRSDGVHVNSDSLGDALARWGVKGPAMKSIPNGVEVPDGFMPAPLILPVRVGFVARLVEDKGVRILVDVIHMLNEERPRMHFEIFGDGPLRPLIVGSGLKNCTLWGERPRSEVLEALRSIHLVLFLSPVENVPSNALLEALALGKAVVATSVGDTSRFLSDGRNAILCSPDAATVAKAVLALSDNHRLYATVTTGARALASANSWEAVADKHLAFYASILAAVTGQTCM